MKRESFFAKRSSVLKINPTRQYVIRESLLRKKELLMAGLKKIFNAPSVDAGYKYEIDILLNELDIDEQSVLSMVIYEFNNRTEDDEFLITCFLFFFQTFIDFIRDKAQKQSEEKLLNDLKHIANNLLYLPKTKNSIIMRYGEKGDKAFFNLYGDVKIIIPQEKAMNITKKDYLYFLAVLIKYNEFGLLNKVININYDKLAIDIEDDLDLQAVSQDNNVSPGKKFEREYIEEITTFKKKLVIKLTDDNEKLKNERVVYKTTAKKLLNTYGLTILEEKKDKNLNFCTPQEYCERINVLPKFSDEFKLKKKRRDLLRMLKTGKTDTPPYFQEGGEEDVEDNNDDINQINQNESYESINSQDSNNFFYHLQIPFYQDVAGVGEKAFFGELALINKDDTRTATIISVNDCHLAALDKKTFNYCLKQGVEEDLKGKLSFFIQLPIFSGIPGNIFLQKYFTSFKQSTMKKGKFIIQQGETPEYIVILNDGSFSLTRHSNLNELSKLIFFLINKVKKLFNNKKDSLDEYKELLLKLTKNMEEAKALSKENIIFKKFYLQDNIYRVTDINCPDIVSYSELIGKDGLYAFSLETKSNKNVIYTLASQTYDELLSRNSSVRKNQKELLKTKLDLLIKRLFTIRNNLIEEFFLCKGQKKTPLIYNDENDTFSKGEKKKTSSF